MATALWTPGQTQARVGLMDGALEAGLFGAYTKDRAGDDREFTAGGLYGLLHILQIEDGPFGQPISGYLGGFGGPMEEGDGVFGAISGVAIGPLVLEYQYQPDTSLATVDNEHLAFVGLRCAFK
ncbi:MAG: hypothetical protein OEV33_00300 [Armatimonadota bacterium]|nr:hypothetical protein [Armatimonadota bacterium]